MTKPNEPTLTCSECQRCGSPRRKVKDIEWYPCTNPACKDFEATCSEVVERLVYAEVLPDSEWHRNGATAILHSWRERRVQELEEALRKLLGPHEWEKDLAEAKESAERLLANSEQIRKGAKHE